MQVRAIPSNSLDNIYCECSNGNFLAPTTLPSNIIIPAPHCYADGAPPLLDACFVLALYLP